MLSIVQFLMGLSLQEIASLELLLIGSKFLLSPPSFIARIPICLLTLECLLNQYALLSRSLHHFSFGHVITSNYRCQNRRRKQL